MATRTKKKNICIVGSQFDMSIIPLDWVKETVQSDLDYIYGEDKVIFDISVGTDGSYRLTFHRHYGDFYTTAANRTHFSGEKDVFAPDAHILLGSMRQDHPTVADLEHWEHPYIQYLSLKDLEQEYIKVSKVRGGAPVTRLDVVNDTETEITFLINF